ncbi:hypothetical protein LIER_12585 [Lithospermum erythrorhizon]|uniref:Uncharacterized protein n=1 Tax=Lithospermum erythrorhizon TaxID=34254 RepID=A0AAV3PWF7_LITER
MTSYWFNVFYSSDLQLAIALQQQEFEQQQTQRNDDIQQQPVSGNSRLVTGPQVPRSSGKQMSTSSNSKQEVKPSKCIVM